MNFNTAILLWGPMVGVLLIDYVLLKYYYHRVPALDRILKFNDGTRLDCILWMVFYVIVPKLGSILLWTTVPGITLIGLIQVSQSLGLKGLLADVLPTAGVAAVVLWLFSQDLARYASHILLHKVPALWTFHKVHHATTEFNVITGNRVSLAEKFFHDVVDFLFLGMIIGLPTPFVALWVLLIRNALNVFQHSDLPWDYGRLGYLFVSPRFHRMHHSSHEIDADRNFGTIFSCWDFIFGTVSRRYIHFSAVADSCELGLSSKAETEEINARWVRSAFNGTGVDYLLISIGRWSAAARLWKGSGPSPREVSSPTIDVTRNDESERATVLVMSAGTRLVSQPPGPRGGDV